MTTYTLEREDTGQELSAYQIRDEAARLDGAATDGMPVPWVAKTPANITPAPTCATCGGAESGRKPRTEDSELPARTWARLSGARQWPQIPHDALTAHGRMEAEFDSAHQQIQDLRDLAFWAEQEQHKAWSAISDDYRAKRASVESRYDREIGHLHAGLDHAPYAAYVQALPDYVRGNTATVATGRHSSVYAELAPERINERESPKAITPDAEMKDSVNSDPPERQPVGREGLDRMVKRVPTAISAQRPPRDTKGDVSLADYVNAIEAAEAAGVKIHPDPKPVPDGTVRESRWARLAAWIGGATTRRRQTEQDGGA